MEAGAMNYELGGNKIWMGVDKVEKSPQTRRTSHKRWSSLKSELELASR